MAHKTNNKGRNKSGGRFVSLSFSLMDTVAWHSLSSIERDLYICIKRRYNSKNNGDIGLSIREARDYLKCTKSRCVKAFDRLKKTGFIVEITKGAFDWKTSESRQSRSTRWLLTEAPQDLPNSSNIAMFSYKSWVPSQEEIIANTIKSNANKERTRKATEAKKKKSRVRPTVPLGSSNGTIKSDMGSSDGTNGYVGRYHKGINCESIGSSDGTVYSIPDTGSVAQASSPSKGQAQPSDVQGNTIASKKNNSKADVVRAVGGFCKIIHLKKSGFGEVVKQHSSNELDAEQLRVAVFREQVFNLAAPQLKQEQSEVISNAE